MPLINMPDFTADILAEFSARGTTRVDTPVIQPAEPFLDMAGEDLRRRIFMTENERGTSLCLRPEFTIPVCLRHIETATGTPKRYAYLGEVFRQRRDLAIAELSGTPGLEIVVPQGAFYLYCDVSGFTDDAQAFCAHFLETEHVAFTPGLDFGHHRAHQHVRIAYTQDVARLQEAVTRIRRGLESWRGA